MSKTVIMIAGTNRSGKTTTSRALLARFGGEAEQRSKAVLVSREGNAACVNADFISGSTRSVIGLTRDLLAEVDTVIVEGMYLGSFGLVPTSVLHCGERQLYVYVYCPAAELKAREASRPNAHGDFAGIVSRQRGVLNAARKYASIGVPVLAYDTGKTSTEELVTGIMDRFARL